MLTIKKVLDQISIIRSKGLKNEIAGYITKFIKKEIRQENAKQAQIKASQTEIEVEQQVEESDNVEDISLPAEDVENTPDETKVETAPVIEETEKPVVDTE